MQHGVMLSEQANFKKRFRGKTLRWEDNINKNFLNRVRGYKVNKSS